MLGDRWIRDDAAPLDAAGSTGAAVPAAAGSTGAASGSVYQDTAPTSPTDGNNLPGDSMGGFIDSSSGVASAVLVMAPSVTNTAEPGKGADALDEAEQSGYESAR